MDQALFNAEMSAMSKPRCPLNGVARKLIPVYKAQHEQGADVSSFEWANLSEMLNCLGKQHQTKCENRVSANMNSRVASSLRVFLRREVAEAVSYTHLTLPTNREV